MQEFEEVVRVGGVLLTTYGKITTKLRHMQRVQWSAVILDEGHKIRNWKTLAAKVKKKKRKTFLKLPIFYSCFFFFFMIGFEKNSINC